MVAGRLRGTAKGGDGVELFHGGGVASGDDERDDNYSCGGVV